MCTWFSASWPRFRYDRKCLFSCIYNSQITISPISLVSAKFNGDRVKNHPKPWICPLNRLTSPLAGRRLWYLPITAGKGRSVDEDHGRGTLFQSGAADGEIAGPIQSFPSKPVARQAERNNPSNKCKDGPLTFLWTNGSAVPVCVPVNPINPGRP